MSGNAKPPADEKPSSEVSDAKKDPLKEFSNDKRSEDDDRFNKDGTPAD